MKYFMFGLLTFVIFMLFCETCSAAPIASVKMFNSRSISSLEFIINDFIAATKDEMKYDVCDVKYLVEVERGLVHDRVYHSGMVMLCEKDATSVN